MVYQRHNHILFHIIAIAVIILTGCGPKVQKPMRVCTGAGSVAEALSLLEKHSQNAVSFRASGQCRLKCLSKGKEKKEHFPVKLWVNPPAEIYAQVDIAFDPKGIVLGCNQEEFWLIIKPKELRSYRWGKWAEQSSSDLIESEARMILETFGILGVDTDPNWSLSKEGGFDVLTQNNKQDQITKKIYISNCDYLIRKVESYDVNTLIEIKELDKYKEVESGFFVPSDVKMIECVGDEKKDSIEIRLKSVKAVNITARQRKRMFTRPEPKGFEHIFRFIDGEMIEQP